MNAQTCIFDMDGVLVDSGVWHRAAWAALLEELGAEPPFGNLFGLPVFVDESLRKDPEIVFNAGTHVEAIRMKYADFEKLVHPVVARVSSAN